MKWTPRSMTRSQDNESPVKAHTEIDRIRNTAAKQVQSIYASTELEQQDQIRLVDLHPGELDDPVCCKLRRVNLDDVRWRPEFEERADAPSYDSLSYVWGDPNVTLPITCSGATMQITVNLHAALKRLRLRNRIRTLWIDAICINQADIPERERQVRRLQQLYSGAKQVVVWLGETDEQEPFKHIGTLLTVMSQDPNLAHIAMPEDIDLEHLLAFFTNPWFCRKWVIQEFVFARSVKFVKGVSEFTLWLARLGDPIPTDPEDLKNGIVLSNNLATSSTLLMPEEAPSAAAIGMAHSGTLIKYWVETQLQGVGWTLSYLLRRTQDYQTSLMADHTIAVLNLACDLDERERAYLVDYCLGPHELFLRTACMILSKDGLAGIKRPIGHGVSWQSQSINQAGFIPSWVPYYLFKFEADPYFVDFAPDETKSNVSLAPKDGRLHLQGSLLGAIDALSYPSKKTSALTSVSQSRKQLHQWQDFMSKTLSDKENNHRKFWHLLQSLVVDQTSRGGSILQMSYHHDTVEKTMTEVLELNDHEVQSLAHDSVHALIWYLATEIWDQATICLTETGYLGFALGKVNTGDQAFVCHQDKSFCFIIRARDDGEFSLIGDVRLSRGDKQPLEPGGAKIREIIIS